LWLSRLVRLAVCIAAVIYLYTQVSWYDQATLARDPERTYRVVGSPGDDPLVLMDPQTGKAFKVERSALATAEQLAGTGRRPMEAGLRSVALGMEARWVIAALLAMAPTTFIMGWRLRYLLRMQEVTISLGEAVWLTFAGNFFNFALPGTTGGDLYKAVHIASHAPRRTEAVTIVLIDRAIGLVSFVLMAAVCILFSWQYGAVGRLGKLVGLMLLATMLGGAIFFSHRFRRWIGYEALLRRLPMADRLRRVDQTAFSFRYHPRQTFVAMIGTIMNNGFLALTILCLVRAVGMPGEGAASARPSGGFYAELFLASTLALSVGYLAAAIPISFQGFGLLEAVFLRIFAGGGWGTASQVLAVCLALRATHLVWSLPGLVVPWLRLRRCDPQAVTKETAT
jgi:uncharacterized membrane protein YbhN (UPF0104 family)